ncbi:MAG: hypothetical protein IKZ34_02640 [Alphaproteobacteria bacterium]|nr:hypothetical protein [Alphaproteobacteria bacterium]
MNKFLCVFGLIGACFVGNSAVAVSAGTVTEADLARGVVIQTPTTSYGSTTADGSLRGNAGLANAYKTNQRNIYYMVTQPDVDTACRTKIYNCLANYCGDVTVVPGQKTSKCQYATETELYNYALLCLQKDTEVLLPQYAVNTRNGTGGMNTAARLCPSYVQQELISYLSMANMAEKLSKSHSDLCLLRRQELEAAMSCHSVALAYANETSSMLNSMLTDFCGAGVPGGSAEMVTRFANAGNVGANIWGWAEKIVNLDLSNKGADWKSAIDAVLAGYTNRMNLACGDNLQMNTTSQPVSNTNSLQTVAALAVSMAFPTTSQKTANPYETQPVWMELTSRSEIYNSSDAYQVVMAGLSNSPTTQNAFLTSAQMNDMQRAYTLGTKVFILRDSTRCYLVPVAQLTEQEENFVSQSFASCTGK